ncbi:S8 family serine peptidase [Bacillus toyonensis]|uniref:Fervidolysin-like N-terminal prodomain domain-containing protein n=1 Tax=Bacillus toyonensis TaxID=155322 RepID=A0A2A8H848_9BACI|nr:hypothetical protein [Bacillus toyonensis]PEP93145.1 hypothetical protein CN585_27130 [Bacillus toyonensis]
MDNRKRFKQGELLIGFYEHVDEQSKNDIHTQFGITKINEIPQLNLDVIMVPINEEQKYKKLYEQLDAVKFVDLNGIASTIHNKHNKKCKHVYNVCNPFNNMENMICPPNDTYYSQKLVTAEGSLNQ